MLNTTYKTISVSPMFSSVLSLVLLLPSQMVLLVYFLGTWQTFIQENGFGLSLVYSGQFAHSLNHFQLVLQQFYHLEWDSQYLWDPVCQLVSVFSPTTPYQKTVDWHNQSLLVVSILEVE